MKISGVRAEIVKTKEPNVDELSQKVLDTLVGLKKLNSYYFGQWYEKAYSKKVALNKPVEFSYEFIYKVVTKSWDNKFPDLGARIPFWNEHGSQISFKIGLTSEIANMPPNNVILENHEGFTEDEYEQIQKILSSIWQIRAFIPFSD